ncbi:HEAT repeat domain-containing protein [Virgisporangium aurantiacum]|uniref:HEAT repeat n=1 Tax=Virgisporangium aurantiacum TaxID=175570 RepID=A0A8J3ZH31_9ACTN|nr:HEAT repeat domain-containing protein [Virgisporangium aurantiacum]GIJ62688.1 hypothetical protein Vau01_102040 [Virgisporangium aurantiacum]
MRERQVDRLVRMLREPDDWRRYQAAKGLGTLVRRHPELAGPAVIEALIAELAGPHFLVRWAAVTSLGHAAADADPSTRHAVVEALVPLLDDPTPLVRARAMLTIGRIDPAPARDLLLARLGGRRPQARAAEALGGMRTDDPTVIAALCAVLADSQAGGAATLSLARMDSSAAVRPLLLHPSNQVRANSLRVLILVEAPGYVELCADALADPSVEVRIRAVAGLAAGARWDLLDAAAADHDRVRLAVADALVRTDDAGALLRRLMADPVGSVRHAARWAWTARLERAPVEHLRAAVADDSPLSRAVAARSLARMGDRTDVDRLRALLDDPDEQVRWEALRALPVLVSRLRLRTAGLRRWLAGPITRLAGHAPERRIREAAKNALASLSISDRHGVYGVRGAPNAERNPHAVHAVDDRGRTG